MRRGSQLLKLHLVLQACAAGFTLPHVSNLLPTIKTSTRAHELSAIQSKIILNAAGDDFENETPLTTSTSSQETLETAKVDDTVVERPDPAILWSAKGDTAQIAIFVVIVAILTAGTAGFIQFLSLLQTTLPSGWYEAWRDYTWPVPMGLIFFAAGITHFTMKKSFSSIVPPPGTWGGLWKVPAPFSEELGLDYEDYWTYVTGVGEVVLGLWLVLSGVHLVPTPVAFPAAFLIILTAAVTPANIYMYTHDAQMEGLPPVPYPNAHYFRGAMQCVILGFFWKLAFP